MTVSSPINSVDYFGTNAVSSYSYPFRIFEPEDMHVSIRDMLTNVETVLTYLLHYTVSGAGQPNGGFVSLEPGFSWMTITGQFKSNWALRLKCVVPLTQELDLINQSGYYPEDLEEALDKLTRGLQQIYGSVQSPTGPIGITLPFPEPGKVLGWNADGTALVNYSLAGSGGAVIGTTGHMARFTADNVLGDSIMLDNGAMVTVLPANASAPVDPIAWDLSLFRVGKQMSVPGVEIAMHIQTYVPDTGATVSYEKPALLIYAQTAEPSVGLDHDLVALDARAGILPGNTMGRIWGLYSEPNVAAGADGLAYGLEISLGNAGTAEPEGGTALSKYGIYLNSDRGPQPGTQAIWIGNKWHKGICASQTSLITSFLELDKIDSRTDVFRVKPSGQTLIGDMPNNGVLADYTPTIYGSLAVNQMITVPDALTNRNVLVMFTDAPTAKHRIGAGVYQPGSDPYWPVTLESGGFEVLRATTAGVVEFPDRGAVGVVSPANAAWLRYNDAAGALELSADGGAWTALGGGSGGGSIGGSGVVNMLAKFSGSTTTIGPSTIFDDGTSVLIGLTTPTNAADLKVEIEKNQNGAVGAIIRNLNVSSADIFARSNFVARSGASSNDMAIGVTSPFYAPTGAVGASTGFIYSGTLATGGIVVQAGAGSISFQTQTPSPTFVIAGDGSLFLQTSFAVPGIGKMRFNGAAWQIDNGSGYQNISTGGGGGSGGGWQDDGTTIRPITLTDTVVVGFASSDIVDPGALIANGFLYAVSAQTNAVVAAIGFDGSTSTVRVASGGTGTATGVPLAFTTYISGLNLERMRVQVNGNIGINTTLDAGYKLDVNGSVRTGNLTVVGILTGNASGLTGLGNLDASTCFASGMVPILRGGTNNATFTAGRIVKYNGSAIVDSALFDDGLGNVMLGVVAADNPTQGPFTVYRTQNNGTWGIVRNNDTGPLAYSGWVARTGPANSQNDITMGVTSSGFATAFGISALKAFIRAGAQTTGLVIHSDVGAISFQVASTSNLVQIQAGGTISCTGNILCGGTLNGDGSGLVNVPAAALTGAIPDAALSANVARRDQSNSFVGVATFQAPTVHQGNANFATGKGIAAGNTYAVLGASSVELGQGGIPVASFSSTNITLWIAGAYRTLNISGGATGTITYA